jgi:hypothetical protein
MALCPAGFDQTITCEWRTTLQFLDLLIMRRRRHQATNIHVLQPYDAYQRLHSASSSHSDQKLSVFCLQRIFSGVWFCNVRLFFNNLLV